MASDFTFSFTTANPPPPVATNVIINEIDADTPGNDTAEFVELFDGGVGNTALDGLVVVFYNGSNDLSYAAFDLDGFFTNANGYFTLGNAACPESTWCSPATSCRTAPTPSRSMPATRRVFPLAPPSPPPICRTPSSTAPTTRTIRVLLALLNAGQPQVNENGGGSGTTQSSQRCPNGTGGARNTSTYLQGTPTPGGANTCPPPPQPSNSVDRDQPALWRRRQRRRHLSERLCRAVQPRHDHGRYRRLVAAVRVGDGSGWDFGKQPLGGTIAPGQYLPDLAGVGRSRRRRRCRPRISPARST